MVLLGAPLSGTFSTAADRQPAETSGATANKRLPVASPRSAISRTVVGAKSSRREEMRRDGSTTITAIKPAPNCGIDWEERRIARNPARAPPLNALSKLHDGLMSITSATQAVRVPIQVGSGIRSFPPNATNPQTIAATLYHERRGGSCEEPPRPTRIVTKAQ